MLRLIYIFAVTVYILGILEGEVGVKWNPASTNMFVHWGGLSLSHIY